MATEKIEPPEFEKRAFHCPHCGVYAAQGFFNMKYPNGNYMPRLYLSYCEHCRDFIIWLDKNQIYPRTTSVESVNEDLNDEIKSLYSEASLILNDSPRAAAALLRLALQKLCIQLGEKGENINDDIGELVKKGLTPKVQEAMDSLRIVGNNAVHPGEINLDENPNIAKYMFSLLNFIADQTLTRKKEIDEIYKKLPKLAIEGIKKRDSKNKK